MLTQIMETSCIQHACAVVTLQYRTCTDILFVIFKVTCSSLVAMERKLCMTSYRERCGHQCDSLNYTNLHYIICKHKSLPEHSKHNSDPAEPTCNPLLE